MQAHSARALHPTQLNAAAPRRPHLVPRLGPQVLEEIQQFGGTGSPITKLVDVGSGIEVKTPGFVNKGETIVVKTADATYARKVK